MKEYTKPEVVVTAIKSESVMATSGGFVMNNFNKKGKDYTEVPF
jgi:hypothetical protein